MRIDFGADVSPDDAHQRLKGRKKVGRKHNHQARGRAREKQRLTPIRHQRLQVAKRKKFILLVRAYWRGELDVFPSPYIETKEN